MRRALGRAVACGAGAGLAGGVWTFDEHLGPLLTREPPLLNLTFGSMAVHRHTVHSPSLPAPLDLKLCCSRRPPPLGGIDWPAARVLLQWALDTLPPVGASVLEIGSGIGTVAVGLSLASRTNKIIGTDNDCDALRFMRDNSIANGAQGLTIHELSLIHI